MSGASVAVLDHSADIDVLARRLSEIEGWLAGTDDVQGVLDSIDQAQLVRELVRIRGFACELAVSAQRVEVLALRRLAQLGYNFGRGKQELGKAAQRFSAMPASELDAILADPLCARSAIGIYRRIRDAENQAHDRETIDKLKSDQTWSYIAASDDDDDGDLDHVTLEEAAAKVLNACTTRGAEFSIASAASELLESIRCGHTDLNVVAAREVIREAILRDNTCSDDVPQVVTFRSDGGEWVRIPWRNATVGQLCWMADYRLKQAQELISVANGLQRLATDMRSASGGDLLATLGALSTSYATQTAA